MVLLNISQAGPITSISASWFLSSQVQLLSLSLSTSLPQRVTFLNITLCHRFEDMIHRLRPRSGNEAKDVNRDDSANALPIWRIPKNRYNERLIRRLIESTTICEDDYTVISSGDRQIA